MSSPRPATNPAPTLRVSLEGTGESLPVCSPPTARDHISVYSAYSLNTHTHTHTHKVLSRLFTLVVIGRRIMGEGKKTKKLGTAPLFSNLSPQILQSRGRGTRRRRHDDTHIHAVIPIITRERTPRRHCACVVENPVDDTGGVSRSRTHPPHTHLGGFLSKIKSRKIWIFP